MREFASLCSADGETRVGDAGYIVARHSVAGSSAKSVTGKRLPAFQNSLFEFFNDFRQDRGVL